MKDIPSIVLILFTLTCSACTSGAKMDENRFWDLIEKSGKGAYDSFEQSEQLTDLLINEDPADILEFERILYKKMADSYRWDLWAIAYIVRGGASDDGFEYFRAWLIGQGKNTFEAVSKNPKSITALIRTTEQLFENEGLMYAARMAYEDKTGKSMPDHTIKYPSEVVGDPWTEEDLPKLYPELCKMFGWE